jgi:hypothetical protein
VKVVVNMDDGINVEAVAPAKISQCIVRSKRYTKAHDV